MTNAQTRSRGAAISTVPSKCMRSSGRVGRVGQSHRRVLGGRRGTSPAPDEPGPAADRAERVDDAVVLGEVPGVRRARRSSRRPGRRSTMSSTTGSSVIAGGQPAGDASPDPATRRSRRRPRRTWTSSARIESATSSAVSAPRSMPAGARSAAIRSSPTVVSSRSQSRTTAARVGDATRPTYAASRVSARPDAPPRPRCPGSRRRRTGARPDRRPRMSARRETRSAPGNASASAIGSKTVTRQPAAAPSAASAPAIGRRAGDPQERRRADAVPRRSPACHPSGRS